MGEHGEEQHGNLLYQSTMHVPLVIVGPGFPAGLSDAPVSTRRLFFTMLEWAGLGAAHSLRQDETEVVMAEAMKPFLDSVPEPLMHGAGPAPHAGLQQAFDGLYPPGDQWYWRADFVKEVPDEAVKLHAQFGEALPTMKSTMHMYPIDGAAHDVASEDTAWSYRDAHWGSVYAGVDPAVENAGAIKDWTVGYFEALHPHSAGGAYVNMMMDEGQERVKASYRDNYGRLAQIKAQYDPQNVFRVNQNIEPAA